MRAGGFVAVGIGLVVAVPGCLGALANGASGATAAGPSNLLSGPARGLTAIHALGGDVDVAAARSGMTADALRELLVADRTAWVDETGNLFYVEPDQATALTAPPTEAAAFPYAATSRCTPGRLPPARSSSTSTATACQSSAWNDSTHPVIDVPAYTMDGDAAFSQGELDVVQEVWARVAEDYAPFDVDVTTEDPGTAALVRSSADDTAYGMRASVTTDPDMRTVLCSGGCAGVAYVGVFDNVMGSSGPWYQPAWALPRPTYTAAQVAEIVSHEVGHTLGLSHDGLNGSAYYQDATGAKIWSPVMGAGYTPLTQFSNGDYSGATQTQDDLAVIAQNGPTVVGDDYGNTVGTAFPLGTGDATAAGLVTSRTDVDVFAISRSCAEALTASVIPAPLGPGLDTQLRLLDASGRVVAVSSPATARAGTWSPVLTGMGASISQSLAPGTYYLEVDGVGLVDPALGYSDYGSVGRYTVAVSGCPDAGTPSPPPTPSPSPSPSPSPTVGTTATPTTTPTPTPTTYAVPAAPLVRAVKPGSVGKPLTIRLSWRPPLASGGTPVTAYEVLVWKAKPAGRGVTRVSTLLVEPAQHHLLLKLPAGRYRFAVAAENVVGTGPRSARTALVAPR